MIALDALSDLGVEVCEQPVAPDALDALERLAALGWCRIAADESVPALLDKEAASAIRVWVLKPSALGGLLPCLRAARRGQEMGIESYVSAGFEGKVARTGAAHLAAAMPSSDWAHGLSTGEWLPAHEAGPVPIRGRLFIGLGPGLGLQETMA